MYLVNSLKGNCPPLILSSPPGAEVCAGTLMVRYFDLNLCDKSTFPVITFPRKYAVELSSVYYNCIISINHDRGSVKCGKTI